MPIELVDRLRLEAKIPVKVTREPSDGPIGSLVRQAGGFAPDGGPKSFGAEPAPAPPPLPMSRRR